MSLTLRFDRIKRIGNKYKYTISGYVRHQKISNVPESIILVILLFYYNTLESSILTDEECDKLLSLFEEQNKFKELGNYTYKLIYKATRDGQGRNAFVSRCYNKHNLLCIILTKKGDVFGGYTAKGWKQDRRSIEDMKAFIFLIRSTNDYPAQILNALEGYSTTVTLAYSYCVFGGDWEIRISKEGKDGKCSFIRSFEKPSYGSWLAGDFMDEDSSDEDEEDRETFFEVSELEVFQLM